MTCGPAAMVGSQELPVPRRCWSIWGLVVSLGNNSGLWQEQPGKDCYERSCGTEARLSGTSPAIPPAPRRAKSPGDIFIYFLRCHLVSPGRLGSRRYTPADLLLARLRKWKDHPATLQHTGFTTVPCTVTPLYYLINYITLQYGLTTYFPERRWHDGARTRHDAAFLQSDSFRAGRLRAQGGPWRRVRGRGRGCGQGRGWLSFLDAGRSGEPARAVLGLREHVALDAPPQLRFIRDLVKISPSLLLHTHRLRQQVAEHQRQRRRPRAATLAALAAAAARSTGCAQGATRSVRLRATRRGGR